MSVASHFIHTCTIQRATEAEDEYNENTKTWATHLSGVRFRLIEKNEREAPGVMAEQPLITTYLALMPADTDVDEDDRITEIIYEDGSTDDRIFTIETKAIRRGRAAKHISLQLERVR